MSDQSLGSSLEYSMSIKLLTEHLLEVLSLKGGCTCSSESTHVKMPHCWKSHVTAYFSFEKHGQQSVWSVFMPPKELWEAYSNLTVCPSVRPSVSPSCFRVRCIFPTFFEEGIPNLVSGYIVGWRSVAYHFRVTVTLTSDSF